MVLGKSGNSLEERVFVFEENGCSNVHSQVKENETKDSCISPQEYQESRHLLIDCNRNLSQEQQSNGVGIPGVISGLLKVKKPVKGSSTSLSSKFRRLVTKDGLVDIKYANIPGTSSPYFRDLFHTLMDAKWRYITLLFTLSFLLSWLIFGSSWYAIVQYRNNETCIDNVEDWTSAFLFSIEIQTTIGFGGRAVTSQCPEGVLLLVVQTIIGMFINCAMLGLLFAKLARPKNRSKAIMFSKKAVITVREGCYCLIFRYVDFRHRRLLDSNMRLAIVRPKLTEEGEFVPLDMTDLRITIDYHQIEYTLRLFPLFPVTIIHVIDKLSPLYKMSKSQLEQSDFEIIAILEGTVPTTGSTTQAITSYRPNEIFWGHRFHPVFHGLQIGQTINRIDLSTLHHTYKENHTPDCAPEEYHNNKDEIESLVGSHGYQSGTRSNYSNDHQALSPLDWDVSKPMRKKLSESAIDIDTDVVEKNPQLKETDA